MSRANKHQLRKNDMTVSGITILLFWPGLLFFVALLYLKLANRVEHGWNVLLRAVLWIIIALLFWKGIPMYLGALAAETALAGSMLHAYINFFENSLRYIIAPLAAVMFMLVCIAYAWSWFAMSNDC